ncbi:MAG: hypothetical protein U0520_05180 [Candidatus Saccharimonadales bacterium]
MIREQGEDARVGIVSSGIHAFVSVSNVSTDTWRYTIAKSSPLIDFPIEELYAALNENDPATDSENAWGGSDLIGGSPRSAGSRLSPDDVFEIIEEHLRSRVK